MAETTPFDQGNTLLAEGPAMLTVEPVGEPGRQQKMAVTIRTPSTTLTVILDRAHGKLWAQRIADGAAGLQPLLAAPRNGQAGG